MMAGRKYSWVTDAADRDELEIKQRGLGKSSNKAMEMGARGMQI